MDGLRNISLVLSTGASRETVSIVIDMIYKSPLNAFQYWNIVEIYWNDIFRILNLYLPTFSKKWIDGNQLDITLGDFLIQLKEDKNPRLVRAFNAAIWEIPLEIGEWDYPSLNILKDLCYNECFLYEEKEDDFD